MSPVHPTRRPTDTATVILVTLALIAGIFVIAPEPAQAGFHGNFGSFLTSVNDEDFVSVLEDAPGGEAFCLGFMEDSNNPADPGSYAWMFHIATGGTCAGSSPDAHRTWLITAFGGNSAQRWVTSADTQYTGQSFDGIEELDDPATDTWVCQLESDGVDGYSIGDPIYIKQGFTTGATQQLAEHDLRLSAVSSSTLTPFSVSVGLVETTHSDYTRGGESSGSPPAADPSRLPIDRTMECGGFEVKMLNLGSLGVVNSQDVFYLSHEDLLTDETVYPGMLRITSVSGISGHGNKVLTANNDNKRTLEDVSGSLSLVVVDDLGSGDILDKKLAIQQNNHPAGDNTAIRMNDVYIKRGTGHSASSPGSLATQAPSSSQIGVGSAIDADVALAGQIFYIDTSPMGTFDTSDPVYIKHPDNGACTAGMEVGDIRLNVDDQSAGTSVRSSDSDYLAHQGTAGICGFELKLGSDQDDTRMPLKTVSNGKFLSDTDISMWDPATDPVFITTTSTLTVGGDHRQVWDPAANAGAGGPVNLEFNCDTTDPTDPAWCTESLQTGGKLKTTGQKSAWLDDGEDDGDRLYWSDDTSLTVGDYRMGETTNHVSTVGQVAMGDGDVDPGALFQSSGVTLFASQHATTFPHPTSGDIQIYPSFGTQWTHSTTGAVPMTTEPAFELVRADLGDSGSLLDDVYYLDFSPSDFDTGRVMRLLPHDSKSAGGFVLSGDTVELQATKHRTGDASDADHFGFIDESPTGFDANDFVYLNLPNSATMGGSAGQTLTQWDSRITPLSHGGSSFSAGTQVITGDDDLQSFSGNALEGAGDGTGTGAAKIIWWDTNHNGVVDQADALWLRLRDSPAGLSTETPTFLDIRLNGAPASSPGSPGSPSQPATAPTASFTTEMDDRNLTVNAGASSATSGRSITDYSWEFGDGGAASGSSAIRGHQYSEDGQFTVRLTVTDSQGETGITTHTVQTDGYVPPESPTDTSDETESPDETETPNGTETPTGDEEPTPGPAVLIVLVALGAALVALRRRR